MRTTSLPPGSDANGWDAHRKRDVGIRRGAIEARTNSKMRVDRANARHDGRIVGQIRGRPAPDFPHFRGYFRADRPRILHLLRTRHGILQTGDQLFDLLIAFRADIDLGACTGGDRVNTGAAFNQPHVYRYLRRGTRIDGSLVDKQRDGAAEGMHRVGDAEIAPAVPACPRELNFETATAERLRGDMIRRRAIEDEEGADSLNQFGLRAEVPDSRQVPLALLADVCHEKQSAPDIGEIGRGLYGPGHGEQRGEARTVVGDTRTAKVAFDVDRDVFPDARRNNSVEVSGERNQRSFRFGMKGRKNIARAIDSHVPADRTELTGHPFGTLLFEKSGRRHATELQMDLIDPLFLACEPLQCLANPRAFSHFADCRGRGQEITRHTLSVRHGYWPDRF